MIEISDARGEPIALFDDKPWSRLLQKPMNIVDRRDRVRLQIRSQWHQGKMEFRDAGGAVVGGLTAGTGGGIRIELVRAAVAGFISPRRLCLLAAVIGLDLFDRDRAL